MTSDSPNTADIPRYGNRYASDAVWSEVDELRQKLRMIISHASGGHLSNPGDIDRSVNDICVEISRHHNHIWEHAQEVARATLAKVTKP
jgi:UDP-N-acetylglucosamine transferase subunit ALG13